MSQQEKTLEQVLAEYMVATERQAAQEDVPIETRFLSEFPQYDKELREFFDLHLQLTDSSADQPAGEPAALPPLEADSTDSSLVVSLPRFLGDYEILEEIDRGGMGIVFKAQHQKLNRTVALKLIRSGELASKEEVERFMSEARAAATLEHPGIVPIYEVGTWNGLVYYTMGYIQGKSLATLSAEGPMEPLEAVRIVRKLCSAIEFAHRSGVVHRDLKPANILINDAGEPVVIDFGLAKNVHHDPALTTTGQLLGTPAYMAPEHASGRIKEVGADADIYALGAILYCLCAGRAAFSGPTPFDVLLQVLDLRPTRPSKYNRQVSRSIDFVCLRMLEKEPAQRYSSLRDFATDLQHILAGEPIDLPQESAVEQIQKWWQREPVLATHVAGIGMTLIIVILAYWVREQTTALFTYRVELLVGWLVVSAILQFAMSSARFRDITIFGWLAIDTIMITILISFASPPREMLLVGYSMLTVASGLFYRRRFVITTTLACIGCVGFLAWRYPGEFFAMPDFMAIHISGLIIVGLCMLAVIRRVRGLSRFYDSQ